MSECSCVRCTSLCRKAPGWFTPDEARRAIDAGFAEQLMLDYWIKHPSNVYILCPATLRHEKTRAANTDELYGDMSFAEAMLAAPSKGICVFLDRGLCSIHASGFKPLQCVSAKGCEPNVGLDNTEMSSHWDNPEAQALVRE